MQPSLLTEEWTEHKNESWVKLHWSSLLKMKEKRNPYSVLLTQTRLSKLLCEIWNECPFLFSESPVRAPPVMVLNRCFPWSANSFPLSSEKNEAPLLGDQTFPACFKVWNAFKLLTALSNLRRSSNLDLLLAGLIVALLSSRIKYVGL